jgi:copper chaperone NosL
MTRRRALLMLAVLLGPAACKEDKAEAPPARAVTEDAIGQFCGMALAEHPGPKGQIFVQGKADPLWFATVRELFAFLRLPEYPKNIAAMYVTDMAQAADWSRPEPGPWMDAKRAFYVVGSRRRSGMDTDELVPFGTDAAARGFAAEHGGRVFAYADVPLEAVFPVTEERS